MFIENFNPQAQTTTTDILKKRITILPDDNPDAELPPGVVKLSGTPATDEAEQQTLLASTLLYEGR